MDKEKNKHGEQDVSDRQAIEEKIKLTKEFFASLWPEEIKECKAEAEREWSDSTDGVFFRTTIVVSQFFESRDALSKGESEDEVHFALSSFGRPSTETMVNKLNKARPKLKLADS